MSSLEKTTWNFQCIRNFYIGFWWICFMFEGLNPAWMQQVFLSYCHLFPHDLHPCFFSSVPMWCPQLLMCPLLFVLSLLEQGPALCLQPLFGRAEEAQWFPKNWALLALEAALMLHAVFIEFFYWIWDFCPADLSEIGWWSAKAFRETRKKKNSTKPISWSSQMLRLFKIVFKSHSLIWKK